MEHTVCVCLVLVAKFYSIEHSTFFRYGKVLIAFHSCFSLSFFPHTLFCQPMLCACLAFSCWFHFIIAGPLFNFKFISTATLPPERRTVKYEKFSAVFLLLTGKPIFSFTETWLQIDIITRRWTWVTHCCNTRN